MFTGFKVKYPEYEVITPQTKLSFTVRSLNVMEEEHLKGSFINPSKVTDHLNQSIFNAIVKKPENVTDFKSFLKATTLKDREALLFGLYHITYEEVRNYDVKCSHCKKEFPVTIKASSAFSISLYPDNDILSKRINIKLPICEGVTAVIKQPTLFDETEALSKVGSGNLDIITQTLIIEKFTQETSDSKTDNEVTDKQDIINAYYTLPPKDRKLIHDTYKENFGNYGISMKMKTYCRFCHEEDLIDIDLVENFFRMVYGA